MRRLLIDAQKRQLAVKFRNELKEDRDPLTDLRRLADNLNGNEQQYVQAIIDRWDDLIVAEPNFNNMISYFERIIPPNDITSIYKKIVKAMGYDYVQKSIYPKFMMDLGIKTCVYCNAQYSFSYKDKRYTFGNYQLDHWKPESKYPYLSTSFFNLQPCCAHCNQMKLHREATFNLYTASQDDNLFPMQFRILPESIAKYLSTHQKEDLKIIYECESEELKNNHEKLFHITTQYQAHKDIVEEIIWKKETYNSTFLDIYRNTFKNLGFSAGLFNRFIIGNYDTPEDIHKRPLSLMTQCLAKQLKLIK